MKRFIKWLINRFVKRVGKMEWEEKLGLTIGVVIGVVLSITTFRELELLLDNVVNYGPTEKQTVVIIFSIATGYFSCSIVSLLLTDAILLLEFLGKLFCDIIKKINFKKN